MLGEHARGSLAGDRGALFVDSKEEPLCLFRVVTRRGWLPLNLRAGSSPAVINSHAMVSGSS